MNNPFNFKIVSGGQTGVDQAALDAAAELGISYGGWLPKGRLTEDGPLPVSYVGMSEMPTKDYLKRTEQNVIDSDITVVICHGEPSGGTKRTLAFAEKHGRPSWRVDLDDDPENQRLFAEQFVLRGHGGATINFAGPRGSKAPGIYDEAKQFIIALFKGFASHVNSQQDGAEGEVET